MATAASTDVDRRAPVIARTEIEIDAERQAVWDVLTDLASWPEWKPDVRSLSLRGPLEPGSTFVWKAGPGRIHSRLEQVDPPRKIAWSGRTLGLKAVDVFTLEARPGGTLVVEEESWSGLPARLLPSRMRATLQTSIERGLRQLKDEVERRERAMVVA